MSESGQRQRVIRALKSLDAIPVENPMRPGTPDVNCTVAWLELKWLRRWPARPDTVVRIEHFTNRQRMFLRRRWGIARGGAGAAWLLLQVGREWLLFDGETAGDHVGRVCRSELYNLARVRWTQGLSNKELQECLTTDWGSWSGSPLVRPSSSSVADLVRTRPRPPDVAA